jgi:hypothetical protein
VKRHTKSYTELSLLFGIFFHKLKARFMPEKETEQGHATEEEKTTPRTGVKRPLVPVVLALMLGLAGAAWGLQIPGVWLAVALVGLLAVLIGLYFLTPFRDSADKRAGRQ